MTLKAYGNNVVVEPVKDEASAKAEALGFAVGSDAKSTRGKIVSLPETVISTGDGFTCTPVGKDGAEAFFGLKVGDVITFPSYSPRISKIDGKEYAVVSIREIDAIIAE